MTDWPTVLVAADAGAGLLIDRVALGTMSIVVDVTLVT